MSSPKVPEKYKWIKSLEKGERTVMLFGDGSRCIIWGISLFILHFPFIAQRKYCFTK
ncbi:MAG: hypothetical protein IPJ81_16015 [Chitinophagaceae bacterium]|nr:hypothetical protein [Chitinophagaceae bacterium]